jgi:hypothetical protein
VGVGVGEWVGGYGVVCNEVQRLAV